MQPFVARRTGPYPDICDRPPTGLKWCEFFGKLASEAMYEPTKLQFSMSQNSIALAKSYQWRNGWGNWGNSGVLTGSECLSVAILLLWILAVLFQAAHLPDSSHPHSHSEHALFWDLANCISGLELVEISWNMLKAAEGWPCGSRCSALLHDSLDACSGLRNAPAAKCNSIYF